MKTSMIRKAAAVLAALTLMTGAAMSAACAKGISATCNACAADKAAMKNEQVSSEMKPPLITNFLQKTSASSNSETTGIFFI